MGSTNKGMFLPTNFQWDIEQINNSESSSGTKEFLVRMYQYIGSMSNVINLKESAIYDTTEFVTGKVYFPKQNLTSETLQVPKLRQSYRKAIPWVDAAGIPKHLPNGTPDTVPHGITFDANTILVGIEAYATDPTHRMYIPIPFVSCKLGVIGIWATGTDIVIDCCGFDGTDYTITNVVIEYLKY